MSTSRIAPSPPLATAEPGTGRPPFRTRRVSESESRCRSGRRIRKQRHRQINQLRAHIFAQALGLRVRPRGGSDALAEQPDDHKVERPQVRELVAAYFEVARLAHHFL